MFSQFLPSHLVPFAELSPWLIGAVALAHFAGFFIRGAFGFGSNMPIVLATTWLLSPHHAIILVMLTATAAQVHLMPQGVRAADWRVVWTVTPGLALGIVVGTWLFAELEADGLILVMAARPPAPSAAAARSISSSSISSWSAARRRRCGVPISPSPVSSS